MTTIKDSKLFRAALVSVLAFALMITMLPFMPAKQADAILPPPNPWISVETGGYFYNPITDRFIITPNGDGVELELGGVGLEFNTERYVTPFWNQQQTPEWRVALSTKHVTVEDIINEALQVTDEHGVPCLDTTWDSDHVLGFITDEGTYELYVASWDKISGTTPTLNMGLNTSNVPGAGVNLFGRGNGAGDIVLANSGYYPRAVISANSEAFTLQDNETANYYFDGSMEPSGYQLRYLEGAVLGTSNAQADRFDTWGRRLPQRVQGLVIMELNHEF